MYFIYKHNIHLKYQKNITLLKKHDIDNQPPRKYKEIGPSSSAVSKKRLVEIDKEDSLPITQE